MLAVYNHKASMFLFFFFFIASLIYLLKHRCVSCLELLLAQTRGSFVIAECIGG